MQNSISRCVFEFGDIRHPSCIGYACIEITVQQVFKNVLWILCVTSAAIGLVFDHGLNIKYPPDTKNQTVTYHKVALAILLDPIVHPAVSHIRIFLMDFHDLLCDPFSQQFTAALNMIQPAVISCPGDL